VRPNVLDSSHEYVFSLKVTKNSGKNLTIHALVIRGFGIVVLSEYPQTDSCYYTLISADHKAPFNPLSAKKS